MLSWKDDLDFKVQSSKFRVQSSKFHVVAHTRIPSIVDRARVSIIPHDPEAFARAIYAELHQCDEAGAELIIIEALPESPEWNAIRDRLNRAAAE
jgi:L-threonylcarbamoyladenylate synthase